MSLFTEEYPSLDSYWRSIILFGKNSATYKFALAKSLLELSPQTNTFISLEELAVPFCQHISTHLKTNDKQSTSTSSKFIDACRQLNEQKMEQDHLIQYAVKYGFENVLDAFHNVNQNHIPVQFFETIKTGKKPKGIIITDNFYKLKETSQASNFILETEARWRLVETAWALGLAPSLVEVKYDELKGEFFVDSSDKRRRTDITSARASLIGYQKAKCFYCFDDISTDPNHDLFADIDHFFPHSLQNSTQTNLNGIWNLVLACKRCNRGENGKFAKIPEIHLLERLHKRNSFFINSHNPLRETLMNQTGKSEKQRITFLQQMNSFAINQLVQYWKPHNTFTPAF